MPARTLALFAVLALVAPARADEVSDAEAKVKEFLKEKKAEGVGRVTALTADGLKETFPDHVVFAHVIPQYPIARPAPEPLKHANVIAVSKKDGKPVLITDVKELEKFFQANARPVKKAEDADDVVKAWLRAASELNQDGIFKFTVKADPSKADGDTITASGEAPVDGKNGDKGQVKATLTFKDGKLASAETKADLKAGIRPICQSTKLLDPDPLVRRMAEDALRVM
ncbi:MAG: hypothetical protein K2V38_05665, partial [Gemmataceae bacterium]|nr:hypothetical protein [Gemmataceae bacterium]